MRTCHPRGDRRSFVISLGVRRDRRRTDWLRFERALFGDLLFLRAWIFERNQNFPFRIQDVILSEKLSEKPRCAIDIRLVRKTPRLTQDGVLVYHLHHALSPTTT